MFADGLDNSWQNYNMGVGNEVQVTGDGVYEVSLTAEQVGATTKADPQDGALVFLVDIDGMGKAMKSVGTLRENDKEELKDTDAKVKVAIFVDGQKITSNSDNLVLGDIEGNGRFRIDISNAYDGSGTGISENPACDTAALTPESEIKVVFSITGTGVGTAGDTDLEAYLQANGYVEGATEATTEAITEAKDDQTTAAPAADDKKDDKKEGLSGGVIAAITPATNPNITPLGNFMHISTGPLDPAWFTTNTQGPSSKGTSHSVFIRWEKRRIAPVASL